MTDSWVPLAAIGGIVLVATRAYQNAEKGTGIGLGGGGSGFGVNIWEFLFGTTTGDEGKAGGGGADNPSGPADKPGGTGGSASEPGEDQSGGKDNGGQDKPGGGAGGNKPEGGNDGNGSTGGNGGGGVGGGSGGGIGSGSSSGGYGDLDQGGSQGDDNGGGDDEGDYDHDPYQGVIIDVDLAPPDISKPMLDKVRETVRTLVNGSILDPGTSPDAAERLPTELYVYDPDKGDLLRYWADVALHYNYDLPWGRLDKDRPSHIPWINLWIDTLAYTTVYDSEENGGFDNPPPMAMSARQGKVRRRGLGDVGPPLLITRDVPINPFTRTVA